MSEHDDELQERDRSDGEGSDAAEPELTDDEETEQEFNAQAEPPSPPPSEAEIERRMAKLENEAQRHSKRVAEIMGDDFAILLPSPLDWTPGFVFRPDIAPLDPMARAATLQYLGMESGADLHDDPERHQCDLCGGRGKLKTGSLVENQEALNCRNCHGQGWVGEGNLPPLAPPTPLAPAANAVAGPLPPSMLPPPNVPVQAADRWGRPAGHPHYNIDPVQIGVA